MQKVITVTESKSIRKKLMAATSMLLVAIIMLVSATYAWFTLSTAPEITGITTAVGANGNLEIALATKDTWGTTDPASNVGDSMAVNTPDKANITWGNLIDVSDTSIYGLDKIMLYPASLNYDDETHVNTGTLIKTPEYGTDGRVTTLTANGVTGTYDGTSGFAVSDNKGVRAIGVASALTDRQLAYRSVLSTISAQMLAAQGAAQTSLMNNGSTFANILVNHAMGSDTYTEADLEAIKSAIASLKTAAGNIKSGIDAAIIGYAASAEGQNVITDDVVFTAFSDAITDGYTITSGKLSIDVTTDSGSQTVEVTLPTAIVTMYDKYTDMMDHITAAENATKDVTEYTWATLSTPLNYLVDTDAVTVNDLTVDEIQAEGGKDELLNSYTEKQGITVQMATGAGVYADIADFCGDYSQSIKITEVSYGGVTLKNVPATMATKSSVNPSYLAAAKTAVSGAGAPTSTVTTDSKITDYYGYALDLLFRTNAEGSTLQLQVDEAQRIYNDSTNEETQGAGSNMTFKSTTSGFSTADVQNLMACIRVVFTDEGGKILGTAKLDMDNVTTTSDGSSKANLMLYTTTDGEDTFLGKDAQDLVLLNKNQKTRVTAIVYLDGENITNADVANATSSMTGTMNLQFTSTATLVPMENAGLKGATSTSGDASDAGTN